VDEHGRTELPKAALPEVMVGAFLDFLRETLVWKTKGLSQGQLTWAYAPSSLTLLGMVKHLTRVERYWFQEVLAGNEATHPWTDEQRAANWRIEPDEGADVIRERYWATVARSREIAAAMTWQQIAVGGNGDRAGLSMGWVVSHMVEETARHVGHADLIRERLDGATGE